MKLCTRRINNDRMTNSLVSNSCTGFMQEEKVKVENPKKKRLRLASEAQSQYRIHGNAEAVDQAYRRSRETGVWKMA